MTTNARAGRKSYSIHSSGGRLVAVLDAWSATEALIEYLRGQGYRDDEMTRMGTAAVAWRGAVFTAAPS
jgi:hypothetical protein